MATIRKDASETADYYGTNSIATVQAEKLYERVISEFGQLDGERGYKMAELAQLELTALRQLTVGKIAPEIDGSDLYNKPLKLSEYRGKIVALLFWRPWPFDDGEVSNYRGLVKRMNGKPFVLLGIYTGNEQETAKIMAEEQQFDWPTFQDGRENRISDAYRARGNPTIYVLDGNGVICYRGIRSYEEVAGAVDKLLKE